MDQASFESFVKQHQPPPADPSRLAEQQLTAQEELQEWLGQLDILYAMVRAYLEPYIETGQVLVETGTVRLFEEQVGSYEATSMLLRVGKIPIQFEPIGTFLIGMKGRIEVTGPNGSASLALVSKEAQNVASMVRLASTALNSHVNIGVEIGSHSSSPSITWVWKLVTTSAQREFLELNAETLYQLIVELSPA